MGPKASVVARLVERHPAAADWLLTGVVTLVALGGQRLGAGDDGSRIRPPALGILFAVAGSLPIAWRRRFPLGVLAVTELVVLAELLLGLGGVGEVGGAAPGVVVALYTVAASCQRRVSTLAAAAVVVVNAVVLLVLPLVGDAARGPDPVLAVLLLGGSWLVGDSVRTRRAYTAELEQRAARLEREREAKAVRAVTEERARIARELHDVVAHHVSVIAVQAGAAAEEAASDPARQALGLIQQASRQVLAELRSLLGVLGSGRAELGLAPQPSLGEVDRLVAQSRAVGLSVELVIRGAPRPLPALLELAAYRIVQEALTNTRKHAGPARARVEIGYGEEVLEVRVTDDGRTGAGWAGNRSDGRGLIGMRERVALVGGRLEVGPLPGGGFGVAAVLPVAGGP
jgi:signal transduction histidine kinase